MLIRKNIFLIITFLFFYGCSFSSNQYSEWFGNKSLKKFEDLKENMWTFSEGDQNYTLLAVSVSPEKSIFADREGRYILFDGWNIIEKGGFKSQIIKS